MVLKPGSDENNDIKETVAEKGDAIAEMEEDLVFDQPRLKRYEFKRTRPWSRTTTCVASAATTTLPLEPFQFNLNQPQRHQWKRSMATLAEGQLHPLECDMYASLAIGQKMKAVPATMRATPCGNTVAGSQER